MANSASSDSTPSFGGHASTDGALRAAPAQAIPLPVIAGIPDAEEAQERGGTEILEIVGPVRPRSSSAATPTSAPGNTPVQHYNISSRSPSQRPVGSSSGPRAASARPSAPTSASRSGIAPGTEEPDRPSQPVSYGPVRSNTISTVANDSLASAVNPTCNTAILTTGDAVAGGVGTSPFGNANPPTTSVAQVPEHVAQVPNSIQRLTHARPTSAPIPRTSRAVNPSEVVGMDASPTATKRVAETPLVKGRGRSPRGDPSAASSATAVELQRIKDDGAARTLASRVQAQQGQDEVACLGQALAKTQAEYRVLFGELELAKAQHAGIVASLQAEVNQHVNDKQIHESNMLHEEAF